MRKAEAQKILATGVHGDVVSALQHVLVNYREHGKWLTIHQAAKLANTSVRSFQRILSTHGAEFSRLVDKTRCRRAIELLENTDVSLPAIAKELGYATEHNLSRAFKRWTGKSPAAMRRVAALSGK